MTKLFASALLCFALLTTLRGQVNEKSAANQYMEIGIKDIKLIDQFMVVVPGVGSNARDMLQQQSVKPYMMPVRKVGMRGNELSYAMASCLEYYVNLEKNYKDNLSPDYISLSLQNSGKQVNVEEAYLFLVQNGTVSAAIMPYDASAITNAVYATPKYQISNYLYLFRPVTQSRQKIYETRKALMRGNPVVVEVRADDTARNLQDSDTWEPPRNGTTLFPVVVVGYDETKNAFEVRSAWGSNWGNGGYAWISYDDFGKYTDNGYVMVPFPNY
jgi:hypothetical protein